MHDHPTTRHCRPALIVLLIVAGFLWLVLASSDDDGPEWSGVSHVDGRN
jgi:hypothetical protein